MSIQFDHTEASLFHSARPGPAQADWTRIPFMTDVWRITRDTEVQFADGSTALWAVDPTIGFHEIDLSVLKDRPVRMRQTGAPAYMRTRDLLSFWGATRFG